MQLEQPINLFASGALALVLAARGAGRAAWPMLMAAGACVGAAALVRQVAVLPGVVLGVALLADRGEPWRRRLRRASALAVGFLVPWVMAAGVLAGQGALVAAWEDVVRYGRAYATDTPPEPGAPPWWMRWLTGNADPAGRLSWPFGDTDYLVWWGAGSWPFWAASVPALGWLLFRRDDVRSGRRLVAFWTLAAWVELALPRQFWAHYYLLPAPGVSIAVAVLLGDGLRAARGGAVGRRVLGGLVVLAMVAGLVGTAFIQVRDYLLVPAEELAPRYKGGGQWLVLRALGRELGRRAGALGPDPGLFVWGIQSPLYFYSGLDDVTPQVFADNLVRAYADGNHPLVRPRIERTLRDLRERRPALIFAGYPPFEGLRALLGDEYLPAPPVEVLGRPLPQYPNGLGLWVRRDLYAAFAGAASGDESDPAGARR